MCIPRRRICQKSFLQGVNDPTTGGIIISKNSRGWGRGRPPNGYSSKEGTRTPQEQRKRWFSIYHVKSPACNWTPHVWLPAPPAISSLLLVPDPARPTRPRGKTGSCTKLLTIPSGCSGSFLPRERLEQGCSGAKWQCQCKEVINWMRVWSFGNTFYWTFSYLKKGLSIYDMKEQPATRLFTPG